MGMGKCVADYYCRENIPHQQKMLERKARASALLLFAIGMVPQAASRGAGPAFDPAPEEVGYDFNGVADVLWKHERENQPHHQ